MCMFLSQERLAVTTDIALAVGKNNIFLSQAPGEELNILKIHNI